MSIGLGETTERDHMEKPVFKYECIQCHEIHIDPYGFESDAYEEPELCPDCLVKERIKVMKEANGKT